MRRFKIGDEVYTRPNQDRLGSFAEFISMNEDAVAIKPKGLTMEEAASIPLIHAGSGGVGTFAIQLAKHMGATVATTTSTANIDLVKSLRADIAIDYKKEKVLRDYDLVLNSLRKETLEKSLQVLKPGGKLISISGPPDPDFAKEIGSNRILRLVMHVLSYGIRKKAKHHNVSYSFLFMRANGDQLREISLLVNAGAVRPVVDRLSIRIDQ